MSKLAFPVQRTYYWYEFTIHIRTLTHSQAIKNDNDDISHKWASQTTKITQTVHNRIHDSGQDHIPCVQSRRMHYCCVVVYNFLILSSKPKQQDSWLSNSVAVDCNTWSLFFPKIRYFFLDMHALCRPTTRLILLWFAFLIVYSKPNLPNHAWWQSVTSVLACLIRPHNDINAHVQKHDLIKNHVVEDYQLLTLM